MNCIWCCILTTEVDLRTCQYRSVGNSQQDNEDQSLETKGTNRQETNEEDDAAADFAEDLPAAMTEQSGVGPQSRLQRFDSLARGESADGVRHSRYVNPQWPPAFICLSACLHTCACTCIYTLRTCDCFVIRCVPSCGGHHTGKCLVTAVAEEVVLTNK